MSEQDQEVRELRVALSAAEKKLEHYRKLLLKLHGLHLVRDWDKYQVDPIDPTAPEVPGVSDA